MKKQKILIGMSGGVDSSVTAKILKEQDNELVGITLWLSGEKEHFNEKAEKAAGICNTLGIRHMVLDMRKSFSSNVVDYFIHSYQKGMTPNPCVYCNMHIKFGSLLEWALDNGFDKVATGHYAGILYDELKNRYLLHKAIDNKKDQTYFLYGLTQFQLSKIVMPLGEYYKDDIKKLAVDLGYETEQYKESQEICFIPDGNYRDYINMKTGNIPDPGWFIDIHGNKIKQHQGIISYTIGQRKGLGLSLGYPAYVIDVNVKNNTVTVGREENLYKDHMYVTDFNNIKYDCLNDGTYNVKIRHTKKEAQAFVQMEGDRVYVKFAEPQKAVTAGQSAVIYEDDIVVGGGIIVY